MWVGAVHRLSPKRQQIPRLSRKVGCRLLGSRFHAISFSFASLLIACVQLKAPPLKGVQVRRAKAVRLDTSHRWNYYQIANIPGSFRRARPVAGVPCVAKSTNLSASSFSQAVRRVIGKG